MRYILADDFSHQKFDRKQYLYDTEHLLFFEKACDKYIELISMPSSDLDILFIIGHNTFVYSYLCDNKEKLYESTIVLITCNSEYNYASIVKDKNIYISNQTSSNEAELYLGDKFNFKFDITESELLFYNCPESDIFKRIQLCFDKLN